MLNGKIACLRVSEKGGHRLKAVPARVAWFARERPVRAGRLTAVIRSQVRIFGYECGWYRGRIAFRPKAVGRRAFLFARRPPILSLIIQ